jgi:hypothetical protein
MINSLAVLAIILLMTSLLLVVPSDTILLAQAKKLSSSSSSHHHTTKAAKTGVRSSNSGLRGFAMQPPTGTESLTPAATANNSADALAIAHRLAITSVNASRTQGDPCMPQRDHFILPPKEARFTAIKQCVTVTGTVVWVHYFNNDDDANFNVARTYGNEAVSRTGPLPVLA